MVRSVNNTYNYNGNTYVRRNEKDALVGFYLASAASAVLFKLLPSFSNPFEKQMLREHANNYLYRDSFDRAVEQSGLLQKGLQVEHLVFSPQEGAALRDGFAVADAEIKAGLNACYEPKLKTIRLNKDKATITGFHELGHAVNHLSGKFGKVLQKLRVPGYVISGLMASIATFSRPKPKDAPRNALDWVLDNCTTIAVAGMLPTVAEEAMASYKGIKLAKTVGLSEPLVKNLKKFYGKALLSYAGYATVTGLAVYSMSKIMEIFTRPKKIS